MKTRYNARRLRVALATVAAAAALSACGGGGGGDGSEQPSAISQQVSSLLAYMNQLIAGTDETSEPVDIEAVAVPVDDTAEPSAI
jgi:hypothetical protein